MSTYKVLVPLAQGCEELEAVTIIDLLRRAGMTVITASLDDNPVVCSRGVVLVADQLLDNLIDEASIASFDLMVLPGGLPGADNLNADARIHQLISQLSSAGKYIGAICAAPKVLVDNGVLDNKHATAYPGALDSTDSSAVTLLPDAIVIDDKVITSRGPGTAMDFALQLIEIIMGKEVRDSVEQPLQR